MNHITAVILCGGKGERLRPYTETIPKSLVELNGKPILFHLMQYLAWHGISDFVLCTGHKAEMIQSFVEHSAPKARRIVCVESGDSTMTTRLLRAEPHIPGRFLICYGDTLANVDLPALVAQHEAAHPTMTMTVFPLQSAYGIVDMEEDRVTRFREKPRLPYWINIGFMICDREAFRYIRPEDDMPEFLDKLVASKQLMAFRHEGRHLTINTPKELRQAEVEIRDFFTIHNER